MIALKRELELYAIMIMACAAQVRREGLLALEELKEALMQKLELKSDDDTRDALVVGLQFIVNGYTTDFISQYYDLRMESNDRYEQKLLLKLVKTGILGIQSGLPTVCLAYLLDALIPDCIRRKNFVLNLINVSERDLTGELLFDDDEEIPF
jgi:flagellar motor component MotA